MTRVINFVSRRDNDQNCDRMHDKMHSNCETMGYIEKTLKLEDPRDGQDNVSRGIIFREQRIVLMPMV